MAMKKIFSSLILILVFCTYIASRRLGIVSLANDSPSGISVPDAQATNPVTANGMVSRSASGVRSSSQSSRSSRRASSVSPALSGAEGSASSVSSTSRSSSSRPPAPPSSSSSSAVPQGKYRNGSYTGISADAFYGNVQVKVIVQGGKISNVQFLDHPQGRETSVAINNQAMPLLTSEALRAQSAPVNIISGATFTSTAFNQSLASALAQAAN